MRLIWYFSVAGDNDFMQNKSTSISIKPISWQTTSTKRTGFYSNILLFNVLHHISGKGNIPSCKFILHLGANMYFPPSYTRYILKKKALIVLHVVLKWINCILLQGWISKNTLLSNTSGFIRLCMILKSFEPYNGHSVHLRRKWYKQIYLRIC